MLAPDQFQKSPLGVSVGDDDARGVFSAVGKRDAAGNAIANEHLGDGRAGSDLGTAALSGTGQRLGQNAHASFDKSPEPPLPRGAAHAVVEQQVTRARAERAGPATDHAVGRQRHLELLRLEPSVEELAGARREQRYQTFELGPAQLQQPPCAPGEGSPIAERSGR